MRFETYVNTKNVEMYKPKYSHSHRNSHRNSHSHRYMYTCINISISHVIYSFFLSKSTCFSNEEYVISSEAIQLMAVYKIANKNPETIIPDQIPDVKN